VSDGLQPSRCFSLRRAQTIEGKEDEGKRLRYGVLPERRARRIGWVEGCVPAVVEDRRSLSFLQTAASHEIAFGHCAVGTWYERARFARAVYHNYRELALGWSDHDVAKGYVALFATLEIDGTGQGFMAVECTTGDTGNLLIIDDGLAVLDDGDHTAD
jgi:hypothetical protein